MNFEIAMFTLFIIKYTATNCLAWDMVFIPYIGRKNYDKTSNQPAKA